MSNQPGLWTWATQQEAARLARRTDPDTSHEAADVIEPHLGKIQAEVLAAYRRHGPMTARRCERLECFADYGFSTIRKRISELHRLGYLLETGVDRTGRAPATIYSAASE